jgi:hypothetical protein
MSLARPFPLSLDEFVRSHRALSREEFLARVVDPHLLLVHAPAAAMTSSSTDFATLRLLPAERRREQFLLPVRKRPGSNAFGMMVTIGRAPNNDIILPHANVSKLQCYLHRFAGPWTLCDPGSTNGTFVDGVRLRRERGVPLTSGAAIQLADVYEVVFLDPNDLYDVVVNGDARASRRLPVGASG